MERRNRDPWAEIARQLGQPGGTAAGSPGVPVDWLRLAKLPIKLAAWSVIGFLAGYWGSGRLWKKVGQ